MAIKKKLGRPKKNIEIIVEKTIPVKKEDGNVIFNPPVIKVETPKTGGCVVEGCSEPIAPGQTFVCVGHQRSH